MTPHSKEHPFREYIELLKRLIRIPSFSKQEEKTAEQIFLFLQQKGIVPLRENNNIWATSKNFQTDTNLPVILFSSHHDTVKDNKSWTENPFGAKEDQDKVIGLGSNDAGASLVALTATFCHFNQMEKMPFRFILSLTAEEEITGIQGIVSILPKLGKIDFAIIGEPTQMQAAIAEKGLLVIDAVAKGKSGHIARGEGINAIYAAIKDIEWLRTYVPTKTSTILGKVVINVTQIQGGYQHNVTPNSCQFTIDIRTNEHYTHQDILDVLNHSLRSQLSPRSTHLQSSFTPQQHPAIQTCRTLNLMTFGSPTISDWCILKHIPAIKIGPGDSQRSHRANEYIYKHEIVNGIETYINFIDHLQLN